MTAEGEQYGTLYLKEYMIQRDGASYIGITGLMTVRQDKDAFGFVARGADANWVVEVRGPSERIVVLGCQVKGAIFHAPDADLTHAFYRVP